MSLRLIISPFILFCAANAFAAPPSPAPDQAAGAILEKAELEWWVKSSTEYASPRFAVVTAINKSKALVVYVEKIPTIVIEKRTVTIFGDQRKNQRVAKFIIATVKYTYSLEKSPVYSVDGRRLKKGEALAVLRLGQALLLSSDGKMVAPRYLQAMKKNTLVLIPDVVQPLRESDLLKK